jgi:2-phosphoglycerate kinase
MIYLIGGPPRSGKTILSKKISKRLGIPCISCDTLETIVRAHIPKNQWKQKFPKNEIRKMTKQNNDIMYSSYTAGQIMRSYAKQARTSWRTIELFIECELKEGNDYILEGHQIHPVLVSRLKKKYGKGIHEVFLVRTDPVILIKDALKNKAPNDWFIKKTKQEKTYTKIASMLCLYGVYLKKEAEKNNLSVVLTDSFRNGISAAATLLLR